MSKRPLTLAYVLFYGLFSPDAWQMLTGLLLAWIVTPAMAPAGAGWPAVIVLYFMLAAIGYAASGVILRPLFRRLHRRMLDRKRP